jgi:hypothetical protein
MKRLLAAALFSAAVFFLLSSPAAAQSTRTFTLGAGGNMAPAAPGFDLSGATTYFGGLVAGQVVGTTPGTFTLSVAFRNTGVIDPVAGVYRGEVVSPYSSFAVTQASGRKSVSTSGTINAGVVTYRLMANGLAEIVSVTSNNLTVWEGKNKSRRAVGNGTVNYSTSAGGSGTMTLYFF